MADHVEREFGTYTRGKRHTAPAKEKDVKVLQQAYHDSGYHILSRGTKIRDKENKAEDFMTEGYIKLHKDKGLAKWVDQRTFKRSTMERWGPGVYGREESTGSEGGNPDSENSRTGESGIVEGSVSG